MALTHSAWAVALFEHHGGLVVLGLAVMIHNREALSAIASWKWSKDVGLGLHALCRNGVAPSLSLARRTFRTVDELP